MQKTLDEGKDLPYYQKLVDMLFSKESKAPVGMGDVRKAEYEDQPKLSPELEDISLAESAGGKNTEHDLIQAGVHKGERAIGQTGLLPSTVDEIKRIDPVLMEQYPELLKMSHEERTKYLSSKPSLEAILANRYKEYINQRIPNDEDRQTVAWNQGITGAKRLTPEQVKQHKYLKMVKSRVAARDRAPASIAPKQ